MGEECSLVRDVPNEGRTAENVASALPLFNGAQHADETSVCFLLVALVSTFVRGACLGGKYRLS